MQPNDNEKLKKAMDKPFSDNVNDELDDVFSQGEEQSNTDDDFDQLKEDDKVVRYIKNIGIPTKIVINRQRHIEWYRKDGILIRVETVSDPTDLDDVKKAKRYGINLVEGRKAWIYFNNGQLKSIRETFIDDSFKTLNFPHIINFPIGDNARNERTYTIFVDQIKEINRSYDCDLLLERFAFLVETDKDGKFDREKSEFLKQINSPIEKKSDTQSIDWKSMQEVPMSQVKKQSPDSKPVTIEKADSADAISIKNS